MKKIGILLVLSFLACKHESKKIVLSKLNGYWQIEKVQFPSGEEKVFLSNPSVDFIQLTDSLQGYRVKLVPLLDGKFATNEIKEYFTIQNNKLHYKTDYSEWKEELVEVDDSVFTVKNQDEKYYFYKRVNNEEE